MMSMIFVVVAVVVFLQFCYAQLKFDLNIKTYYTLRELEELDRLRAEKSAARKKKRADFFKKIFRK